MELGAIPSATTNIMITLSDVKDLRERSGAGYEQCRKALEDCEGNAHLAWHYLCYLGCAVNVSPMSNQEWAMERAKKEILVCGEKDYTNYPRELLEKLYCI